MHLDNIYIYVCIYINIYILFYVYIYIYTFSKNTKCIYESKSLLTVHAEKLIRIFSTIARLRKFRRACFCCAGSKSIHMVNKFWRRSGPAFIQGSCLLGFGRGGCTCGTLPFSQSCTTSYSGGTASSSMMGNAVTNCSVS